MITISSTPHGRAAQAVLCKSSQPSATLGVVSNPYIWKRGRARLNASALKTEGPSKVPVGSNPTASSNFTQSSSVVERSPEKAGVVGAIPTSGTISRRIIEGHNPLAFSDTTVIFQECPAVQHQKSRAQTVVINFSKRNEKSPKVITKEPHTCVAAAVAPEPTRARDSVTQSVSVTMSLRHVSDTRSVKDFQMTSISTPDTSRICGTAKEASAPFQDFQCISTLTGHQGYSNHPTTHPLTELKIVEDTSKVMSSSCALASTTCETHLPLSKLQNSSKDSGIRDGVVTCRPGKTRPTLIGGVGSNPTVSAKTRKHDRVAMCPVANRKPTNTCSLGSIPSVSARFQHVHTSVIGKTYWFVKPVAKACGGSIPSVRTNFIS